MTDILGRIRAEGRLRQSDVSDDHIILSARAFVYGLARMESDGHYPEWHPAEPPASAAQAALSFFISATFRD